SIDFYFFSIGGTVTIHLGSLALAAAPPPPPVATQLGGGVLQLNLGVDAGARGIPALPTENFIITLFADHGSNQDLMISAPGVATDPQIFYGVTSLVVHGTDTSDTTIQIADNVRVPITINAGSGTNQFI